MPQAPNFDNSSDPLRNIPINPLMVELLKSSPEHLAGYLQRIQPGNIPPDLARFIMGNPPPQDPGLLRRIQSGWDRDMGQGTLGVRG